MSLMNYPQGSPLPKRARNRHDALSASVAREHAHRSAFGKGAPIPVRTTAYVRVAARSMTFGQGAFRASDYGQVCQALGLRPSKPNASAAA